MTTQTRKRGGAPFSARLLLPAYWPTWIGLGLLRLLTLLPYRWLLKLGGLLGLLIMKSGKRRRHIAATNLRLCFPELDDAAREQLLHKHFVSLGISTVEMGIGWWASARQLDTLTHIEGLEHLEAASEQGKGVLLLSAHFTTLEMGGILLAKASPYIINALYRPHENPVFEWVQKRGRERYLASTIPRDDMRTMVRNLRHNEAIWYAPDQNYGHKHSVFADFFGIPAASNTSTTRLARMSGAAVIPFFQRRRDDCSGYDLILLPALDNFPGESAEEDTYRINQIFEAQIRKSPEQYLWVHRRFKDRPAGQRDVYNPDKVW